MSSRSGSLLLLASADVRASDDVIAFEGVCERHDPQRPICSTPGCNTTVQARGLCQTHGAFGFCTFDNCTTAAISTALGRCCRHGGRSKVPCLIDGCTNIGRMRGICVKHAKLAN